MVLFPRIPKRLATIFAIVLLITIALALFLPLVSDAQTTRTAPRVSSCIGWTGVDVTCVIGKIISFISATLILVGVWILSAAGLLFNLLVQYTVINFAGFFYYGGMQVAIETAWTAFRDIANIFIIGMFVFIAISIILGANDFGNKRLVAKVLIIAILINFSLLFTKVIIDFSNFTAYQFYKAASLQSGDESKGLAGAFIHFLGVSGFGDTMEATTQVAQSNNNGIAFVHGIMSFIFLLAAAAVLFYGSFLLISRAILLTFLLLTSALAFASYLLPTGILKNFGWSVWWNTLLKSAVFAPILMLFLWITLRVSEGLRVNIGTIGHQPTTLGNALTNPTTPGAVEVIFMYLIVLGLLFVSFKVASSFSSGITGFDWASVLPAGLIGMGSGLLGQLGRDTAGRFGMNAGQRLQSYVKDTMPKDTAMQRLRANMLDSLAQPLKALGKKDFNAMRTPLAKPIAKASGLSAETLAGGKKAIGGAAAEIAKQAEKDKNKFDRSGIMPAAAYKKGVGDKETEKGRLADAEQKAKNMREEVAMAAANTVASGAKKTAEAEAAGRARNDELMEAIASRGKKEEYDKAAVEVKLADADITKLNGNQKQMAQEIGKTIKGLRQERKELSVKVSDKESMSRKAEIDKEIKQQKSKLKTALRESDEGIKGARQRSDSARKVQDTIEREADRALKAGKKSNEKVDKQAASRMSRDISEAISRSLGHGAGESKAYKDKWAEMDRKKSQSNQDLQAILQQMRKDVDGGEKGGGGGDKK